MEHEVSSTNDMFLFGLFSAGNDTDKTGQIQSLHPAREMQDPFSS